MKITIEQGDNAETELIVRCADPNADEILKIKKALQELDDQLPVQQRDTLIMLSPRSVLYFEYVNRKVFA